MSAISEVASFWMEGAMRTIDAFRNGFGITMDDPEPATPSRVVYESGLVKLRYYEARGTERHRVPLLLIYSLIKSFSPFPASPNNWSPFIVVAWMLLGVAVLVILKVRGGETWLQKAGEIIDSHTVTAEGAERIDGDADGNQN